MSDLFDVKSRMWALLAVIGGIALLFVLELQGEPRMSAFDLVMELVDVIPIVLTSVGVVFLFRATHRQHEEQRTLIREIEVARAQGQRWRSEARAFLNGLGEAIEAQFSRWNLTDAECEIALLLLKGLSLKEIATVRATSERTVRTQARSLYSKAGLTGRAGLSAFFLEDLLAPIAGLE
ncbi:MAG: helix-turn-helix transcriptional regulator [Gammaproteobacteria bacterium]